MTFGWLDGKGLTHVVVKHTHSCGDLWVAIRCRLDVYLTYEGFIIPNLVVTCLACLAMEGAPGAA